MSDTIDSKLLLYLTFHIFVLEVSGSQYKSYSLTGNTASQLSQVVRERLMMGSQSLPKSGVQDYGFILRQGRSKASDGSLSDTQAIDNTSPYAPWLRHRFGTLQKTCILTYFCFIIAILIQ